ncbi:MAG: STAS domain-containing protein [Fibrobacterota bacterium]
MPDIKFTEYETGKSKDIKVLMLNGSVDAYNSEMLSEKLEAILQDGHYKIVLECSRLKFISSSGMGVFLAMEDDFLSKGGGLKFVAIPDNIMNVFKKVGLSDIFKTYPQEAAAVDDFNRGI